MLNLNNRKNCFSLVGRYWRSYDTNGLYLRRIDECMKMNTRSIVKEWISCRKIWWQRWCNYNPLILYSILLLMGQYFKAALIDNEWGVKVVNLNGWKLMEHAWYGNRSMQRVEKLLYREAKNVYWIWDYSMLSSFVWKHKFEDEEEKMWDYKWEWYKDEDLLKRK